MSQSPADAWRGIAAEETDEVSAGLSSFLRRRSRRLLKDLLRPHRVQAATILVLIVVANVAILAGPWLVGKGVDQIPRLTKTHDAAPLVLLIVAFGFAVAVQAITTRAFIGAIGRLGGKVVLELRRRLFEHFLRLPIAFHEHYTSGRVISRQVSDIDSISDLFEDGLDTLVSAVFTLLLVGTGMLLLDWELALVIMGGSIPLLWLSAWFRRESALSYRRTRETIAQVIVHFVETFGGIRAVQAFRREDRNEEIFTIFNQDYANASLRAARLLAIFFPGVTLVGKLATGAVLLYGGLRVIDHQMQIGILVTFLLYLQRFFEPLVDLSQFYSNFQSAGAALEKISGVLDEAPSVPEPDDPVALPEVSNEARGGRTAKFESVRFGYRQAVVLPGLSLTIPAGQTVAIVGATGAGKTTIARLLARMYDPDEGRVLLDGIDLRQLSERSLRREIILITQENFLFGGSIAENIALGKPTASRAEIIAAAKAIGADGFISALPAGYDELVGKRGGRLSAGQRQLVSFARAFLAAPALLILDEATSLLDIPSERLVQDALHTVLTGRTAVIIAHRLSTVAIADRVLVLARGEIIEDGSPADLLATEGEYSALHADWQASLA
ncbi:MAG TPA: ABC transporter ATP-binding protein [Streptosporangiaceae bacterium]|nr:ABC transporter ATP-binding protein [Streptosporangiaceae bacterium]